VNLREEERFDMPKSINRTHQLPGKKRSAKSPIDKRPQGAPFNEHDPKRRLGNFSGAGEHPRQGGRTSGIVGQTKRRNHTDKNS
jgi:hypothetical protein